MKSFYHFFFIHKTLFLSLKIFLSQSKNPQMKTAKEIPSHFIFAMQTFLLNFSKNMTALI